MPSERRTPTADLDDRVVRTALMSLPSASVLLVDKDLRYRAAVGAAITYYGFEPTKMIGRLVSDTLSPETFLFVEPALRRALAGEMFTEIREIKPLGGATFEMAYGPAVEDGEIVGALVVVRDVTVEHRALTDLTATGELHHMLMSQTSDVIVLTTPVDARYTWVSPSAARVLGWEYDKLVGRTVYDFIHPEDVEPRSAPRATPCSVTREQASVTFRYRRPSRRLHLDRRADPPRCADADGADHRPAVDPPRRHRAEAPGGGAVPGAHDVRAGVHRGADRDVARVGRRALPAGQRTRSASCSGGTRTPCCG